MALNVESPGYADAQIESRALRKGRLETSGSEYSPGEVVFLVNAWLNTAQLPYVYALETKKNEARGETIIRIELLGFLVV